MKPALVGAAATLIAALIAAYVEFAKPTAQPLPPAPAPTAATSDLPTSTPIPPIATVPPTPPPVPTAPTDAQGTAPHRADVEESLRIISAAQVDPAVEVRVVDFAFDPVSLRVVAGTTVTWTNAGDRPHTVTADDGSFDSGTLQPGQQFSHTFRSAGRFSYTCGFHSDMRAAVTVVEAGTTYTSPTFGYKLTYDESWEPTENLSDRDGDRLVLYNGTSYVALTGKTAFGGDPRRCVDDVVEEMIDYQRTTDFIVATDEEGTPVRGSTGATGAYAIYHHGFSVDGETEPYTLFVGCVPLVPGEAVLAIVQNVPTAEYSDQVAPRETLLRGLTLAE